MNIILNMPESSSVVTDQVWSLQFTISISSSELLSIPETLTEIINDQLHSF